MASKFTLRELQPTDSLAITKLITEFDGDMTTRFLVNPYAAIVYGTENRTTGVVVEAEGTERIIGWGPFALAQSDITETFSRLLFWMGSRSTRISAAMVSGTKSQAGGYKRQKRNWETIV